MRKNAGEKASKSDPFPPSGGGREVAGLGDLSPDMWQGFEKVRRPPYTRATQAPPPAHPLITRTAPRHKARVSPRVKYRQAHRPRGMPGYAHQAGDVQPALRGP